jgi:CheY-like chemotaxis protein
VPLIALSGYALPQDIEKSREAGFDVHLAKPLSLPALEIAMAEVEVRQERSSEPRGS